MERVFSTLYYSLSLFLVFFLNTPARLLIHFRSTCQQLLWLYFLFAHPLAALTSSLQSMLFAWSDHRQSLPLIAPVNVHSSAEHLRSSRPPSLPIVHSLCLSVCPCVSSVLWPLLACVCPCLSSDCGPLGLCLSIFLSSVYGLAWKGCPSLSSVNCLLVFFIFLTVCPPYLVVFLSSVRFFFVSWHVCLCADTLNYSLSVILSVLASVCKKNIYHETHLSVSSLMSKTVCLSPSLKLTLSPVCWISCIVMTVWGFSGQSIYPQITSSK